MSLAASRVSLFTFTLALTAVPGACAAEGATELRNWFNDPFFAVSSSISSCQPPRGPLMTKEEMDHDSHARVERGTRCYQQGECRLPNSYLYDADIAANVRAALNASNLLRGTSLWVTVQRRWIFIQGCVNDMAKKKRLESVAARIPDVEHVFVDVTTQPRKLPPYPVVTR